MKKIKLKRQINKAKQEVKKNNKKLALYKEEKDNLLGENENLTLKENLISLLINTKIENSSANEFSKLIKEEFIPFANEESSLKEEAQALLTLQEIGRELNLVASEPEFYSKRTVAIAGGFSAGKSEFISSLFTTNTLHLPSGIQPTTAIPTYVMNSNNGAVSIDAFNHKGAKVDLLQISPDFYNNLSHEFLQMFKFNLRELMPSVFLSLPMKFKHLCFIDTPGYNPSETNAGVTGEDIYVARDYSQRADILIWLIGLDANGTIPKTDLDFLSQIAENEQNKKIYIVLNKADLRPKSNIEDVIDKVEETLEDYDIEVEGISAYSSILKTEIAYHKTALFDFLESINTEVDKRTQILEKLFEVDKQYQVAILSKIREYQSMRNLLDSLPLNEDNGLDKLEELKRYFSEDKLHKQLKRLEEVSLKLEKAINDVFHYQGNTSQRKTLTYFDLIVEEYAKSVASVAKAFTVMRRFSWF